jgi:hypothetical protein
MSGLMCAVWHGPAATGATLRSRVGVQTVREGVGWMPRPFVPKKDVA